MKKIVAWLCFLSILVTLTGCNKTQERTDAEPEESILGSYIEQKISQPKLEAGERRISILSNDKNQMEYYTIVSTEDLLNSTYNCYTLVNGEYQKSSVDWVNKAASEFSFDPVEYCHGQDGTDYILYMKPLNVNSEGYIDVEKIEYGVIKNLEGSNDYINVTPDDWEPGELFLYLDVTQDGMLCYIEDKQLVFYDPVKQEEVNYGSFDTNQDYVLQGNTLYFKPNDENELQMVELNNDKVEKIALESKANEIYLKVTSEGNIILLDNQGIHQYKKGGTMWETILDGTQLSMSSPSNKVINFTLLPGAYETYYVLYRSNLEGNNEFLATYQFSENAIADDATSQLNQNTEVKDQEKQELNIYSVWRNRTLQHFIYEYALLHPEIKINYIVAIEDDEVRSEDFDTVQQFDAIRTINTEILGGNGADIIMLDGLPMANYIDNGILMDMSDCIADSKEGKNLVSNIAQNYIQDGKIYCMPLRFFIPICLMKEDISQYTNSIEDLADFCRTSEKSLMEPLCYQTLAQMMIYIYGNELFSEDGMLMENRLSSFLSSISEIAVQIGSTEDGSRGDTYMGSNFGGTTMRMRKSICGDEETLYSQDVLASFNYFGCEEELHYACGLVKLVNGMYFTVNDTFVPNGIVGINKNTKNEDLAKSFISYLFSDEVQSQKLVDGLPITDTAMDILYHEPYYADHFGGFNVHEPDGTKKPIYNEPLTVEEKQRAVNLARSLTKPAFFDTPCWDMLVNGTVEYLKGEKTLEQAASEISQKINLYMSE